MMKIPFHSILLKQMVFDMLRRVASWLKPWLTKWRVENLQLLEGAILILDSNSCTNIQQPQLFHFSIPTPISIYIYIYIIWYACFKKEKQRDLVMEGIVATIPAHAYMIGIKVLGLFFLSHIKDPNAASDRLSICIFTSQQQSLTLNPFAFILIYMSLPDLHLLPALAEYNPM